MLTRVCRHRWMWAFALVALSFKLVAGTVCLNDRAVSPHAAPAAIAMAAAQEDNVMVAIVDLGDNGACLLGEAGDCHCACPETVPVAGTLRLGFGPVETRFAFHTPAYGFAPAYPARLLRPPIA